MQLSMVIAGGGGGADTHYLCQLSGRWPSTKEAYYTGLSSVRSVQWVSRSATLCILGRLLGCLAVQRCCFVCCDKARCKFCTGLCFKTLGFTECNAPHTIFVSQKLVPHWHSNEYKNTLIASMLFFILYWQIKILDGRASTESLASML